MVLLHRHVMVGGKDERYSSGVIQVPVGGGGVIVIARPCPAQVVHYHAEAPVKPDFILHMEAVQHEALLCVVLHLRIAEYGI